MATRLFSEALKDDEFKRMILDRKASGGTVVEVLNLSNKFDEWELEKYFQRLKELPIDQLYIVENASFDIKPSYRAHLELRDALKHFATYVGVEKRCIPGDNSPAKKFQVFKFENDMVIYFETFDD